MAGQHLTFHSFSYASGELGKARNTMFFRSCISGLGSAGISLVPPGVHLRITVCPNMASLASFWAMVLGLCLGCFFCSTMSTGTNSSFFISVDGSGTLAYTLVKVRESRSSGFGVSSQLLADTASCTSGFTVFGVDTECKSK